MFNISTWTLLAPSSKICRFLLKFFLSHKLHGFVGQCISQIFMIFPSQNSKLECIFESNSLKHMH